MIKTGTLIYEDSSQRYAAFFDDETVGLHCGCCAEVLVKGEWQATRIEFEGEDSIFGWYFVGIGKACQYVGHSIRISI